MGSDAEEEDDDDLTDAWESFANKWEQEFRRFREAEETQLLNLAEAAEKLAAASAQAYVASVEATVIDGDVKAHQNSRVAGHLLDREHSHKFEEMAAQNKQGIKSITSEAMRDADDMVKHIMEEAERKNQERAARLREEKRKRDAELAARQKARQEAAKKDVGVGFNNGDCASGQSAGTGDGDRSGNGRPSASPPPRFTRKPGEHSSASAPTKLGKHTAAQEITTYGAFDAAWRTFEQLLRPGCLPQGGLGLADIPWPTVLPTVSGIEATDGPKERKQKLRTAVLRWHPDKWAPVLGHIRAAEQKEVLDRVAAVTRRILEERKRFS